MTSTKILNMDLLALILVVSSSSLIINQAVYAQVGNLTRLIEEKFTRTTPDVSPSPGITYSGETIVQVDVMYESPTTILISGELIIATTPGIESVGTFNSAIWEAMDLLKNQYGFKIQQVMTSGVGSVGNPTNVYILMTK